MLFQFTVKNYKSIKDEMIFDMQATFITEHEDRTIVDTDGEVYLPACVIYGPNGGGKSNVLESLYTLVAKVPRPLCATCDKEDCNYKVKKIPVTLFLFLEETREEPTEFEVFFRTEQSEYRYILHVKKEEILFESLDRIKMETGRRSALFQREIGEELILKGVFGKF